MNAPGYYKVNYRGLSLAEVARMRGPFRLPLTYLITRFKKPTPSAWMPTTWADLECEKPDLSERFWQATVRHRGEFARLGFTELGLKNLKRVLNPGHRDDGGINYLDASRCHFGQLIYNRAHVPAPVDVERETITISFTAVFEQGLLSYTNNKPSFDSLPQHEVVRIASNDVTSMYQSFLLRLTQLHEAPRRFLNDDSLRRWFDSNQLETFEARVRKGLFVRMSEDEVEAAKRKLPPPLPKGPNAV